MRSVRGVAVNKIRLRGCDGDGIREGCRRCYWTNHREGNSGVDKEENQNDKEQGSEGVMKQEKKTVAGGTDKDIEEETE